MTEREAIKYLTGYLDSVVYKEKCVEAHKMAIKALEEIQQYRAIGTVRQVQDFIADWRKYRELGTLKECRAAVEKQRAKKPNVEGDGYADGHLVYDTWICSNCGKHYEIDYDNYDYCPNCGQKIDWSILDIVDVVS